MLKFKVSIFMNRKEYENIKRQTHSEALYWCFRYQCPQKTYTRMLYNRQKQENIQLPINSRRDKQIVFYLVNKILCSKKYYTAIKRIQVKVVKNNTMYWNESRKDNYSILFLNGDKNHKAELEKINRVASRNQDYRNGWG